MTFQIITPGRFIEAKDAVSIGIGQEGYFRLEAVKRSGRVSREITFRDTGFFQNLILDQGLNGFGNVNANALYARFQVGTGTSTPSVNDTQLVSPVGPIMNSIDAGRDAGVAPDYFSAQNMTATSAVGAFGNANLTEIGIGGSSLESLFSRALIVDAAGNPTAFPIQSDEQLRVTYQLRLYPPLEDAEFDVDVSGMRHVIVRPLGVSSINSWSPVSSNVSQVNVGLTDSSNNAFFDGGLSGITEQVPQGATVSGSNSSALTLHPYNAGSFKRGHRRTWGAGNGNSNQFRTHRLSYNCCQFQVQYDPPLAKNSEQTMFLEYEIAWGRR